MRKGLYISMMLLLQWGVMLGQERVYVSTDKDVYVAGEDIWYSVYCMEGDSGKYSGLSDVAYLQFVSNDGVAATSKVALIDGRGDMAINGGNWYNASYDKPHDVKLVANWKFTHFSFTDGVYNVTGRKNVYSIYFDTDSNGKIKGHKLCIFGAPIPYVNFNFKF